MLPSLFISHGSPMLALEPGASGPALAKLAAELPWPKAIVLVSAHWESPDLRVASGAQPATWHDFGGFPPALFAVQYPAPGEPALAEDIVARLSAAGLPARLDAERPFDHGAWVPMSLMYPAADIPIVQVSLPSAGGPRLQQAIGEALASLREQGILLVGSGSITHNLRELDWHAQGDSGTAWAQAFRDWMVEQLAEARSRAARLPPASALRGAQPSKRRAPVAAVLRPWRWRCVQPGAQRFYPWRVGDGHLPVRLRFLSGIEKPPPGYPGGGFSMFQAVQARWKAGLHPSGLSLRDNGAA
ncbi:DODA-type extradiol aromatic ring-opening family dioxygenase [Pseudomonas sp. KNUC1026]|uniref:DODA-type extradiol aromatic ring-opening family dioxygenase n=1 Tax=Pseudomonas sp. KNUC1026 TaxID=2893890 RepID=UPI002E33671B|nr:class III extradiol ring-cleavage dioxygenase [Pseudomonas sp. KNUC1026]